MSLKKLTKIILLTSSLMMGYIVWPNINNVTREIFCRSPIKRCIHQPLSVLYPQEVEKKAYISVGIICRPDEEFVEQVKQSLLSITKTLKLSPTTESYKIFVGVLGYSIKELQKVETILKFHSDLKDINAFIISPQDTELVMNPPELSLVMGDQKKEFIKRRAEINLLISLLLWRCSQHSEFTLLTDSKLRLMENSIIKFSIHLNSFHDNKDLVEAALAPDHFGILYRSKNMNLLVEYLFRTCLPQSFVWLMSAYRQMLSESVKVKVKSPLFKRIEEADDNPPTSNPKAYISSNASVFREYFPLNPYESNKLFWASTPTEGTFIKFKFFDAVRFKHILIETGKDIYMSDVITRAVLEESYDNNEQGDCNGFHYLGNFHSSRVDIDLSKRGNIKTSCLRIRFTATEQQWVAINQIKILVF